MKENETIPDQIERCKEEILSSKPAGRMWYVREDGSFQRIDNITGAVVLGAVHPTDKDGRAVGPPRKFAVMIFTEIGGRIGLGEYEIGDVARIEVERLLQLVTEWDGETKVVYAQKSMILRSLKRQ